MKLKEFEESLKKFETEDYSQSGLPAAYDVFLPKGTDALKDFSHSMETQFRELGLPTKLNF